MISFEINNGRKLELHQNKPNGGIIMERIASDGTVESRRGIKNGDFVMLINLYEYIKDNDIRNDFINPNGKNTDTEAEEANKKIIENRRKESAEELAEDAKVIKEMMDILSEMISKHEKKISET